MTQPTGFFLYNRVTIWHGGWDGVIDGRGAKDRMDLGWLDGWPFHVDFRKSKVLSFRPLRKKNILKRNKIAWLGVCLGCA